MNEAKDVKPSKDQGSASSSRCYVVNRRKNESPSLFVMRTFAGSSLEMDDRELVACVNWIKSKSESILKKRNEQRNEKTGQGGGGLKSPSTA